MTRVLTSHRDTLALLLLLVGWSAACVLARPIGEFALNDDWVYALAARSVYNDGTFSLPSPSSANAFVHAYWGALFCLPFGFSFSALRVATMTAGLLGLCACFGTLRQAGAGTTTALLASLFIGASPLYFVLSTTFMTDVPFFALSAASLLFMVRWASKERPMDAVLALLLAVAAILTRQIGIVLLLGFAACLLTKRGFTLRSTVIAALFVALGAFVHLGFQTWIHQTGRTPLAIEPPMGEILAEHLRSPAKLVKGLYTLGVYASLFLLPLIAVYLGAVWRLSDVRTRRVLCISFAAAVALGAFALVVIGKPLPFAMNVWTYYGFGPLTLRDTFLSNVNLPQQPLWLAVYWHTLTVLALIALGFGVAAAVSWFRSFGQLTSTQRSIVALGATCIVSYALLSTAGVRSFIDRYSIFVLLPLALLLVVRRDCWPARWSPRIAIALVVIGVVEGAVSVVATYDYLAWSRLRWAITEALRREGVPTTKIDGGYEFNGWYNYRSDYQRSADKSYWWVTDPEYVIASGPLPGYEVVARSPFVRAFSGRREEVVVLRRVPK